MKTKSAIQRRILFLFLAGSLGGATRASAQTDYYNLDQNRPIRIEDAFAKERYAFELTIGAVKLERSGRGVYQWTSEPEIAYGILPRTHVKLGVPIVGLEDDEGIQLGLAGVELALFHNLNAETSLPAIALSASLVVPAGRFAPTRLHPSVAFLATRSFRTARVHANAEYTFGNAAHAGGADDEVHQANRWLAGVAVDRTLPLQSLMLVADVYAAQPLTESSSVAWNAEAGVRYQLDPSLVIDVGVGKALHGGDQGWFVTLGSAYAFGLRSLIPVRR